MSLVLDLLVCVLALVGLAAIALAVLLGRPLKAPPPLASVLDGALQIEPEGLPELSRFQGRDGTWLAYRLYRAGRPPQERSPRPPRPRLGRRLRADECDRQRPGECGLRGGLGRFPRPWRLGDARRRRL